MAVDIARRPYTTVARFHRNSEQQVKIRWYPADPKDGTFPGVSKICSLDWVTHPWTAEGVGEVYGAARTFNRAKKLGPIPGDHFCGTLDEHRRGELLDESKPPMLYHPSGLPLCCDPFRDEGRLAFGYPLTSNEYTTYPTPYSVPTSFALYSDEGTSGPDLFAYSPGSLLVADETTTPPEPLPLWYALESEEGTDPPEPLPLWYALESEEGSTVSPPPPPPPPVEVACCSGHSLSARKYVHITGDSACPDMTGVYPIDWDAGLSKWVGSKVVNGYTVNLDFWCYDPPSFYLGVLTHAFTNFITTCTPFAWDDGGQDYGPIEVAELGIGGYFSCEVRDTP